jgi:ectoine hydroxylase-related dioxygenase (phytanoyl-CoA dioxygenase family)
MQHVDASTATVEVILAAIDADGGCIVDGLLTSDIVRDTRDELIEVLRSTPEGRNFFEGFKTQRIYALFAKTRGFDALAVHPLLLGVLDRVLENYQLSAPVGISIGPGEAAQLLHRDQSIYPLPLSFPPVVFNTMWAFDDFTEANGATRVVAGSHRWTYAPEPDAETVAAVMSAGSVLFYPGTLWHGGGANTTDRPRLGVILEYAASWLRPQENHLLAVPRETVAGLPKRLQELLGYNIYPPFVGYVDGHHPRRSLG